MYHWLAFNNTAPTAATLSMVTELTELLVERHDQCQELAARVKDISRERACLQTVSVGL